MMTTRTLKNGLSVYLSLSFAFLMGLTGCGVNSTNHVFTPQAGFAYIPDDGWAYGPSATAEGNGWENGSYSMGYGGAGQGGFCLGAACFCPEGWTSADFTASMLITDPSASGVLATSGRAILDMENEVNVNSTSSSSVSVGSNSRITAPEFFLVGNYTGTLDGTVHLNQSPLSDPLVFLPEPTTGDLTVRSNSLLSIAGTTTTLQPGVYNGGIALSSGAQVTFAPGLYYFVNGGLSVGSHSKIIGVEVTFYFADASTSTLSIQGGGSAQLSPPADGFTKGLTIFFNRSNSSTVTITGGGNLQIYGSIYAKNTTVNLGGNGNMVAGSQIVAKKITVGGNGTSVITTAGGLYSLPSGCFAP